MILIGIPACTRTVEGQPQHAALPRYSEAVMAAGGLTVIIPPFGPQMAGVLDRLDGLLLSGSPSNVDPAHYGAGDETPGRHDPARDDTTLPLIRAALSRHMPLLAICRGIQELNVALGGSLHQQVHAVTGRQDHREGPGERAHRYRAKHSVRLSGMLAAIIGAPSIDVNSLHEQAIGQLAPGLVAEAYAGDGTIEGVRVAGQPFALGVQWHPEWKAVQNPNSMALLDAFTAACRTYAASRSPP